VACAVLMENQISIRISCRDPGQDKMAKQCLVGLGEDPFAISVLVAMVAAKRFSTAKSFSAVVLLDG
jgi:hypothetical protein